MATTLAQARPAKIGGIIKYSDLLIGISAVVVIGMLMMPIPEWALDIMITLNIAMSLGIMLVGIYTSEPMQFSSFPSMLLVTTLFRLGLNIGATRLVLLNASAGSVVNAFGSVLVGGNYVVGIVIFAILIIIQFVVVTSGTSRVAEVAARFTLDAMPGKQMAIDADMNAGLIDEVEAQRKRKAISDEADFYGAMDGASRFVRGDTIAAIIMIIVNILGGFMVGITQRQMDFMAALQTYTLLTVGVGLATQIPSILISTATGLMVTKTKSDKDLGKDLTTQLLMQPKAITTTASICGVLMLIPGIPKLPFLIITLGGFGLAQLLKHQTAVEKREPQAAAAAAAAQAPVVPEAMTDLLPVDPIEVELGYGLIPLADPKQGGDLLERITAVRRQAALDLGLLVPAIRVRDNMQLKPNTYVLKLRGIEIAQGEVYVGNLLAMNPGTATMELRGINTTEPAFGLPATWVSEVQQSEAELAGYTVVDPLTVMITHVTEILRRHAAEILTRQDTQTLVDTFKERSPAVVSELIPELLSLGDVQRVLQNLLAERVSIRDMGTILETLADAAKVTKDTDALTEHVRQSLCRQIVAEYESSDKVLRVFTLEPTLEQAIADGIRMTDVGSQLVMEPVLAQRILQETRKQVESIAAMGYQPVALCSPRTRIHYRRLAERMVPTLAVLSYNELSAGTGLETVGMVTFSNENVENQSEQYA